MNGDITWAIRWHWRGAGWHTFTVINSNRPDIEISTIFKRFNEKFNLTSFSLFDEICMGPHVQGTQWIQQQCQNFVHGLMNSCFDALTVKTWPHDRKRCYVAQISILMHHIWYTATIFCVVVKLGDGLCKNLLSCPQPYGVRLFCDTNADRHLCCSQTFCSRYSYSVDWKRRLWPITDFGSGIEILSFSHKEYSQEHG